MSTQFVNLGFQGARIYLCRLCFVEAVYRAYLPLWLWLEFFKTQSSLGDVLSSPRDLSLLWSIDMSKILAAGCSSARPKAADRRTHRSGCVVPVTRDILPRMEEVSGASGSFFCVFSRATSSLCSYEHSWVQYLAFSTKLCVPTDRSCFHCGLVRYCTFVAWLNQTCTGIKKDTSLARGAWHKNWPFPLTPPHNA